MRRLLRVITAASLIALSPFALSERSGAEVADFEASAVAVDGCETESNVTVELTVSNNSAMDVFTSVRLDPETDYETGGPITAGSSATYNTGAFMASAGTFVIDISETQGGEPFASLRASWDCDDTGEEDPPAQTRAINAQALNEHGCDDSEWHFVITSVESEELAPATIEVTWANGSTETVPLERVTGGVAHYATTSNLDSTVTSATADIYTAWDGQFNLSHGPCEDAPPPPPPPPSPPENPPPPQNPPPKPPPAAPPAQPPAAPPASPPAAPVASPVVPTAPPAVSPVATPATPPVVTPVAAPASVEVLGVSQTRPGITTLPHTGNSTVIMTIIGLLLVAGGFVMVRTSSKLALRT